MSFPFWASNHGMDTAELKELFRRMLRKRSNRLLRWSLNQLGKWSMIKTSSTPVFQIHGTRDKTLPFSKVLSPNETILNGDHLMVYKKGPQLSEIIVKQLTGD